MRRRNNSELMSIPRLFLAPTEMILGARGRGQSMSFQWGKVAGISFERNVMSFEVCFSSCRAVC